MIDLRAKVRDGRFVDIGKGAEKEYDISRMEFLTAIDLLREEGYVVLRRRMKNKKGVTTEIAILARPGTTDREILHRLGQVKKGK
jgi:hypothetical protein